MAAGRDFFGSNALLGAPKDMENVIPLPVHTTGGEVISCWQLTDLEKEQIAKTGVVWLSIMGQTMPPAYISGVPLMYAFDAQGDAMAYDPDYKEEEEPKCR